MAKIRMILLFVVLMFIGNAALIIIRMTCPSFEHIFQVNIFLFSSVSEFLFIFPALPLYMLLTRQKFTDIIPIKPLGWKNIGYIILMAILLNPAASLLSALTSLFYPNAAAEITSMITYNNFPAAITGVALAPAIAEEICMRGAVLSASRGMNFKLAAAVNGIIFGLIHINPQQMPYAMLLGVIFSLYVIYTHSIFSSILAHFLINASTVVFAFFRPGGPGGMPSADEPLRAIGGLTIVAAIFFAGFCMVFKQFRLYNKNKLRRDTCADIYL